jgi:hypothetical protein
MRDFNIVINFDGLTNNTNITVNAIPGFGELSIEELVAVQKIMVGGMNWIHERVRLAKDRDIEVQKEIEDLTVVDKEDVDKERE